jgi:Prophage tail fibre N-terminal./Putative prophage tail fibre C-terminus.
VGEIEVSEDDKPGTLNAFLMREADAVYYPDSLKKLEEAAEEAVRSAEEAAGRLKTQWGRGGRKVTEASQERQDQPVRLVYLDRRATRARHKSGSFWDLQTLLKLNSHGWFPDTDGTLITGLTFLDPKDATQVQRVFRHLQVWFGDGPWQDIKDLDEVSSETGRTGG